MKQQGQEPNPHAHISGWMWFGFWLLLLGMLGLFFNDWLEQERNPNQNVESRMDAEGVREVVLKRNRYGHYNVTGQINGYKVEFLLDTGATNISIPAKVADKIGLRRLNEIEFYTAAGPAKGFRTKIKDVRIGEIVLSDLKASINPNVDDEIILLGMTFLKRIEFTQRGDLLILRQYPAAAN